MGILKSIAFWVLALLLVGCLYFILSGIVWMHWVAAFFLFCLFIASVIAMVSFPHGKLVGIASFAICVLLSALLWLNNSPVLI